MIAVRRRSEILPAASEVTCTLCGFVFDPSTNPACPSCPIQSGCTIVCCPNCGHDTVDPARSSLVQLGARVGRLLRRTGRDDTRISGPGQTTERPVRTLAEVAPGRQAVVHDLAGLGAERREHLQAYGLVPGREVLVLQHAPVTVVQVEHTHVAFESHLARGIEVVGAGIAPPSPRLKRG